MNDNEKTRAQLLKEIAELRERNTSLEIETRECLKHEEEILDALDYAESVIETVREPLVVLGSDLKVLSANHSFYDIFDTSAEHTIGSFIYELGDGQWDIPDLRALLEDALSQASVLNDYEVAHVFPGIGRKTILLNARKIFRKDFGSNIILLAMEDITERRKMEEQIHELAYYDQLTKLPNRHLLHDRLGQAMAASQRSGQYCALMFLDLDNFKPLNDMHGHAAGDLLLIEVANRLKHCVREVDTVARFGGDEFVVMLNGLNIDEKESGSQAEVIAKKIRASLSAPYLLVMKSAAKEGVTIEHHCTASIGVKLFSSHETSQDEILKLADAAMYQDKETTRLPTELKDE